MDGVGLRNKKSFFFYFFCLFVVYVLIITVYSDFIYFYLTIRNKITIY